jgi:hypothetical protein
MKLTEQVEIVVFPDLKRIARERKAQRDREREERIYADEQRRRQRRDAGRPQPLITFVDADGNPIP